MRRRDWILTVLAAAEDATLTPVQLQKTLFLLTKRELSPVSGEFYTFTPYAYGPFDSMIYQDADTLAAEGYLTTEPTPYGYRRYVATAAGIDHIRDLPAFGQILESVKDTVEWVKSRSFSQLVSDIYRMYPEMRANSVFR